VPIGAIRRLPGGMLAVDVRGDDGLAFARQFLPPTRALTKTTATGEKAYRFLFRDPDAGAS
jgi:hypothetical protein